MNFLLNLIVSALALYAVSQLYSGVYFVPGTGWVEIVLSALVLGLVNALVRPVLGLLSLPITVLTLGLFALVLNGLMLWLTAQFTALEVTGLGAAVVGALLLSLVSWVLNLITGPLRSGGERH
ncbi:phage holin family protein [Deinococcus radiophilus]|uniref:Phage holin family protein n=1 Tax=Deinococcus radiophilus TaxID=32062 RepID=A0A3S0KAY1_9DEIO|nr:phage holin family protein [Deinococcus radiophilus]RTR26651.1 phage holin family protein [Deinococcus radiophilus]UFA51022.1 phage holin family protein [Deinococcus radiophilus]